MAASVLSSCCKGMAHGDFGLSVVLMDMGVDALGI